jgi:transcriptional regulator with PAS, ATPase and Fis domain
MGEIVAASKTMKEVLTQVNQAAPTEATVLIEGESGTGKELVARAIHQGSPRRDRPFIPINCSSFPETLLESELFGYEKGAFTGADRKTRGKFELANKGVLMLDEIGDMSLSLQAKLLHVLQGGAFAPLGSEKEYKTDTWVIAATNHELEKEISEGKFREDLYYRLNIIKIFIQPLRERPEDIPHLIDYYLKEYSLLFNSDKIFHPSATVIDELTKYAWPGNVRELQNILKRMLVLGDAEKILDEMNNRKGTMGAPSAGPTSGTYATGYSGILDFNGKDSPDEPSFSLKTIRKKALDRVEKEVISHVSKKTGWNRSKATKILKISYKTLLYKISDLGITPPSKAD